MKLKGLKNRDYNVMFHVHTVSGIVISFALFIIFYAGAFSLFRDEIVQWENKDLRYPLTEEINIANAIEKVDEAYNLHYYEIANIILPSEHAPVYSIYASHVENDTTNTRMAAYYHESLNKIQDLKAPPTTVGETLYRLHFFDQIPNVGKYISGLVALFFLFATISGIIIHWQNMFTKFYAIVFEGKWKNIWTNMHTVLGLIGIPFQLIYAVTGAFFGLLTFILIPTVLLKYDGDQNKVLQKIRPYDRIEVKEDASLASNNIPIDEIYKNIKRAYPNHEVQTVRMRNYKKEDGFAIWHLASEESILSNGAVVTFLKDGVINQEYSVFPHNKGYSLAVLDYISKLHFGNFGGHTMRVIYFVLAMLTCIMILSGVMIWRKARDNKRYSEKQRSFHHKVTKSYLSICLSLFPATALLFIFNKIVPLDLQDRTLYVNLLFFGLWVLMSVSGYFIEKYSTLNKVFLISGGVIAILIPFVNGIVTGDWFWNTLFTYSNVAIVDIFWLFTGISGLLFSKFNINQSPKDSNHKKFEKELATTY
ncbi:PepSY-associated TM helix domain-containing protein [Flammeovirga agarivorans]|uniref:PepSY domain-containing protein n=1 Tax=Flammeovirga agarivorans TaxID=2726742 RepID=A0A7X8SLE6_9BACT|nr:PepSY-associated TM helix domain-containing protein [Flammeovirga agarivorans]NLR92287.1 PepSY domain-containing protein [Flammeovirga agarivorans]